MSRSLRASVKDSVSREHDAFKAGQSAQFEFEIHPTFLPRASPCLRGIAEGVPHWMRRRRRSRERAAPGRAARSRRRGREAWYAADDGSAGALTRRQARGDLVEFFSANALLQRMLTDPVPGMGEGIGVVSGVGWFLRGTLSRRSAAMERSRSGVFTKVIGNVLVRGIDRWK